MSYTVKATGSYKYFCYTVEQREIVLPPHFQIKKNQRLIHFKLYTLIANQYRIHDRPVIYDERKLISSEFLVKSSRIKRGRLAQSVANCLSDMNVPKEEQPAIAVKIFWLVKEGVPGVPIDVPMGFVTVLVTLRPNSLELDAIIRHTPSCVICTELFEEQQQIIRLACSHHYHKNCFVQWLDINDTCPLCRCPMPIVEDVEEP